MKPFIKLTGVAVFGYAALAYASVPNNFTSGEKLSSAKLNANFAALVDLTSDQSIAGTKVFTGKVAVGTVTPDPNFAMHVVASADNVLRLESTGGIARQWDLNIKNGKLVIGDNTANVDRVTVDTQGRFGVGTVNPATTLHVVGDARVGINGTSGCVQNAAGTGLVGTCSSDARFKKNIRSISGALDKVTQLRPVTYEWRTDEFPERQFGAGRAHGLIAQEVEKVMPELVATDDRGYKAVAYGVELQMLALEAIKELRAKNAALEERIAQLEGRRRN